ncbi:unnamed protein product [Effrenium voratum]|nr:unnamed protein product [Effrenium voratum]
MRWLWLVSVSARPIDDVGTWLQYGEAICWIASGYESCCAPELGPEGSKDCWLMPPLSYSTCCLERWRVCDADITESHVSEDVSVFRHQFMFACASLQRLLNSFHAVVVQNSWLQASGCREAQHQDCNREHEQLGAALQTLDARIREVMAVKHGLPGEQADEGSRVLASWPASSFVHLLSARTGGNDLFGMEQVSLLHLRIGQFRDEMLRLLHAESIALDACGEICETGAELAGKLHPPRKQYSCNALLSSMVAVQDKAPQVPPSSIPPSMLAGFTMNGRVPVLSHSAIRHALGFGSGTLPKREPGGSEWQWSEAAIIALMARARNYTLAPGPNSLQRVRALTEILSDLPSLVHMQRWLVWGDSKHFEWWSPWLESLLLSLGASFVSSLVPVPERYKSTHPQLRAVTLQQAMSDAPFHGVLLMGVSSAGTGRHGDELNPYADLQQAAAAWCLLRAGGTLIAPPMAEADLLRWNVGRVYGPLRWPHLVANFQLLFVRTGVAAVLQKPP